MSSKSIKISIVTPSYNQGQYLEETILSVLNQKYPNLEYIIIDGGSSDNSVEIIKKYEKHLTYWISKRDNGQSEAINNGFRLATGDIFAWQNSDDRYLPGTFEFVSRIFTEKKNVDIIFGGWNFIDKNGEIISYRVIKNFTLLKLRSGHLVPPQPAVFFRKNVIEKVGGLDITKTQVMDYDLYVKIINSSNIYISSRLFGDFRIHAQSKTESRKKEQFRELKQTRHTLLFDKSTGIEKCYWLYSDLYELLKDNMHRLFNLFSLRDLIKYHK